MNTKNKNTTKRSLKETFVASTVILLTAVIVVSFYVDSRYKILLRSVEKETEYQANIFAERSNTILEKADTILRLITVLVARPDDILSGISLETERQIRDELLLNPEIDFITILDHDGSVVWKSIRAPDAEFEGYSDIINNLISSGRKFCISDQYRTGNGESMIMLSRTTVNSNDFKKVITTAIKTSNLLPLNNDPFFTEVHYTGFLDYDFLLLSGKGKETIKDIEELFYEKVLRENNPKTEKISGGINIKHGKAWVSTRVQVKSFPFYAVVFNRFDDQLKKLRLIVMGLVIISAVLIILVALIRLYFYQKKNEIIIIQQKETLEKINMELTNLNKRRELLIQEVHHRVKNNLVLISSIIGIIISNGGPFGRKTLEELDFRINAIADIHEQLYKSDQMDVIRTDEYLIDLTKKTLSAICSFDIDLKIDIQEFWLPDKKAGSLGIIFTEILTNAVKYGLEPGSLLKISGRCENGKYELSLENGGKPYKKGTPGLGSLLIESLTNQIGIETVIDTSGNTRYCLIFKLESPKKA